jgi:hypothetical protein
MSPPVKVSATLETPPLLDVNVTDLAVLSVVIAIPVPATKVRAVAAALAVTVVWPLTGIEAKAF